jgi:hypothetical protein
MERTAERRFAKYKKKQITLIRPWVAGEDMTNITVATADKLNGSPKLGDMVGQNSANPADQWLISWQYFKDNYELSE